MISCLFILCSCRKPPEVYYPPDHDGQVQSEETGEGTGQGSQEEDPEPQGDQEISDQDVPDADGGDYPEALRFERANVSYEEMDFEDYDRDVFDTLSAEMKDIASAEEFSDEDFRQILSVYDRLVEEYVKFHDYYCKYTIEYYRCPSDASFRSGYERADADSVGISDTMFGAVAAAVDSVFGEELKACRGDILSFISGYTEMDDTESQLFSETAELCSEWEAYYSGAEDVEGDKNYVMGNIVLSVVSKRNEIAKIYGFENAYDMAWTETYGRDYGFEKLTEIGDLFSRYTFDLWCEMEDYSDISVDTSDLMTSFAASDKLSPLIRDAAGHISGHHLFVPGNDESFDAGFSWYFYKYAEPIIYYVPSADLREVRTLIHELGHSSNSYITSPEPFLSDLTQSIDVSEIQSNGMIATYSCILNDIYPDISNELSVYFVDRMISSTLSNCIFSEIERMLYTTEDLTYEKACELAGKILYKYGFYQTEKNYTGWATSILHFIAYDPGYCASYVMSDAVVMWMWLNARTDFEKVRDIYDGICALDLSEADFMSVVSDFGFEDIFSEDYYAVLSAELSKLIPKG